MPDTDREADYLTTLLQLGQTLNASLDLAQVLDIAIEQVVRFVQAERGFILLIEEGTHRVTGKAVRGIDPVALEVLLTGRDPENRPAISRTVVEQAIRERRAVLSQNAMEDPRFASHTSVRLGQLRSVLCVPLVVQGRPLGIIYVDSRLKTAMFEERHAEMLEAFANQAAIAIENARLYDNLRRSLEERLRLQQELHENETRRLALEEANRLKSDFIGELSHELRNPLTTIRGYAQTLAGDSALGPAECAEFLETIEAECDRMLDLINALLDSSRLEANRPLLLSARPLNVGPLLEKLARAQRYSPHWTANHRIEVSVAPELPQIEADPDKLHQIVANLLSNAVKYSPAGGRIEVSALPADGGVRLTVRDEGVGISPGECDRLFARYERLDRDDIRRIPGTGLGLYLTRRLVELHGGWIRCEPADGKGTAFSVFLPARPPNPAEGSPG